MRGKIQGGGVPGPAVFRAAAALLSLSALSAPAFTHSYFDPITNQLRQAAQPLPEVEGL